MKELEITKNINIIEMLKSEALYKIADIFQNEPVNGEVISKREAVSDLIIILYLLGEKMGYSYNELDNTILDKIKANVKNEDYAWKEPLAILKGHIESRI